LSPRPKFEIIVWVRRTGAFLALRDELIELAADEPHDACECEDMVDFRWRFESFAKAETAAAALVALRQRAEVDLLPVELRRPPRFRMST
jgi:hypothetical protein